MVPAPSLGRRISRGFGLIVLVVALGAALSALFFRSTFESFTDKIFGPDDKGFTPLVVQTEIRREERFHAGRMGVSETIEIGREEDAGFFPALVPGFCDANNLKVQASGSIDAYIDMSKVGEDDIIVTNDDGRKRVTIALPAPVPDPLTLDVDGLTVINKDEGLCTKLGSDTDDDKKATDQIKAEVERRSQARIPELITQAEESARNHFTRLLEAAGFDEVDVTFDDPTTPPE